MDKYINGFRFFCQKVLPLVYDDSLSYYEVLCKAISKMNEISSIVNTHSDNIEVLDERYEDLENKVEGLIENLVDVIVPWDSSIAYRIFSIVEYQGTNYIAVQDVPVGVMITNTDYWTPANTIIEQINAIGVTVSEMQGTVENIQGTVENIQETLENIPSIPVNVLTLGIKNDGSEDCSDAIETASETMDLFFPEGVYRFDRGIEISHSITGAYRSRGYNRATMTGTILDFSNSESADCIYSNADQITVTNIGIYSPNTATGLHLQGVESLYTLHGVNIVNAKTGVNADPTGGASRCLNMDECTIWGPYPVPITDTIGVRIGDYAYDSIIDRCEIMAVEHACNIYAGGCAVLNSHIWPSGLGGVSYWNRSRCIIIHAGNLKVIGCTLDTANVLLGVSANQCTVNITNCFTTYDASIPTGGNAPTLIVADNAYNTIINIDGLTVDIPTSISSFYLETAGMNGSRKNIRYNNRTAYPFNPVYMPIGNSYQTYIQNTNGNWVIEAARMSGPGAFVLTSGGPSDTYSAIVIRNANGAVRIKRLQGSLDVDYKVESGICKFYVLTGGNTPTQIGVVNLSGNKNLIDPVNTMYNGIPLKSTYESTNSESGLTRATVET